MLGSLKNMTIPNKCNLYTGCGLVTADASDAVVLADHVQITFDDGKVRVSLPNQGKPNYFT